MQVARTAASMMPPAVFFLSFFLSFKPVSLFRKTDLFSLKSQILHFARLIYSA